MPRKTAGRIVAKDKPGQFTTEVKKTIEKARLAGMEEQKKISKDFFLGEIARIESFHALEMKRLKEEKASAKFWSILLVGVVIGSALTALAMSV